MRFLGLLLLVTSVVYGSPTDDFLVAAKEKFGEDGAKAAKFLVENMPPMDRGTLSKELLMENLGLALQVRGEFPWAKQVPEAIFFNDVVPYAVFDEPRESWRSDFHEKAMAMVKDAKSGAEAAMILNRDLFKLLNVHYNTGRKKPNQSPRESIEMGKATCSGLSIILVDACRSVGIPARAVGTPMWTNERGNHTWVEIWDGDWHFTGADEYDVGGLDRGWFVGDAAHAKSDNPRYSIYATSWKREGLSFPLVWARRSEEVAAVNVTSRYAKPGLSDSSFTQLGIRLFDGESGVRLPARVCAIDAAGNQLARAETKAGTADLNDMPRLEIKPGTTGWLRFTVGTEVRELPFGPLTNGEPTVDAEWRKLAPVSESLTGIEKWLASSAANRKMEAGALQVELTKPEAERALALIVDDYFSRLGEERKLEVENQTITNAGLSLRWKSKVFGERPAGGHSLWISMHGGGGAPPEVNDQQWTNQVGLYKLEEGIYVAPRAPTDTWNLWHQEHIDPMFGRLIEDYVAVAGVNPNKVYLMGYSAGGDGVWQLAPRMADRFAAAAMMAGHPNSASLLSLRNLPFAVFVGGNDSAYNRNKVVAERAADLDRLEQSDPGGYVHMSRVYEGLGHWMNRKDAEALPWMAKFERNAWPKKIVWQQGDVIHNRFYWLQIPSGTEIKKGQKLTATVGGQNVDLDGDVPGAIVLELSDQLVDLEQPVSVSVNHRTVFSGKVKRQAVAIVTSLQERPDPVAAATAILNVSSH